METIIGMRTRVCKLLFSTGLKIMDKDQIRKDVEGISVKGEVYFLQGVAMDISMVKEVTGLSVEVPTVPPRDYVLLRIPTENLARFATEHGLIATDLLDLSAVAKGNPNLHFDVTGRYARFVLYQTGTYRVCEQDHCWGVTWAASQISVDFASLEGAHHSQPYEWHLFRC